MEHMCCVSQSQGNEELIGDSDMLLSDLQVWDLQND